MASEHALRSGLKVVKPILSQNREECKRRALNLYKAWYRSIPDLVHRVDLPKSVKQCREKLKEEFRRYNDVTDVRVLDMIIIKGQMELQETVNRWQQKCHMLGRWEETIEPKPKDFLSKFFTNK